ncbi:putative GINS complex subunit Psf3, partial [Cardiosporidium cionae]
IEIKLLSKSIHSWPSFFHHPNLQLVPSDELELQFAYAQLLHNEGRVRIVFPKFFSDALTLKENSLSKTVGLDCPFYFELGLNLCQLIPSEEWPVEELQEILLKSRRQRILHIVSKFPNIPVTFRQGMTYKEKLR